MLSTAYLKLYAPLPVNFIDLLYSWKYIYPYTVRTMESCVTELFEKLTFGLPYTSDNNSENETKGQSVVRRALVHVEKSLDSILDQDLHNATILLAVNLDTHPWNNHQLVKDSYRLYNQLTASGKETYASDEFPDVIQSPIFRDRVNKYISKTLQRHTWQDHAVVCILYSWYCHQLKFPLVSDHLDILLPPSLLLIDSYDDELKVRGVNCLHHMMSESGKAELRWHGRAQVIFDALQKLMYSNYQPLVTILHPAIIKILAVLDGDSSVSGPERKVDSVYQQLLNDMYLEDKLILRRSYAHSVELYVKHLNSRIVKHLKQTMKVVLNYLEDSCGSAEITRLAMLQVLKLLVEVAQPRIRTYYTDVTKCVLRLVVDTAMLPMDCDSREDIFSKAADIFRSMNWEHLRESLDIIITKLPIEQDEKGRSLLKYLQHIQSAALS